MKQDNVTNKSTPGSNPKPAESGTVPHGQPVIQITDLKVHFPIYQGIIFQRQIGEVKAVDGVNLTIYRGETLGLVGESGCGKTTLGRAIVRLYKPTSGSIIFEKQDISTIEGSQLRQLRRRVQMVFQDPFASLNPRLTVGNIIAEPIIVHGDYFPYNLLLLVSLSLLLASGIARSSLAFQENWLQVGLALLLGWVIAQAALFLKGVGRRTTLYLALAATLLALFYGLTRGFPANFLESVLRVGVVIGLYAGLVALVIYLALLGFHYITTYRPLGKRAQERAAELLKLVNLSPIFADRYPHEFSGGQRQRIAVARAIAINPEFVVADEPVSALDVSVRAQVINLMQRLQKQFGLTYVFVSHDLSVVRHVSDRIAVMYLGKIMEIADRDSLYKNPLHPYTVSLLSAVPIPDPKIEKQRQRIILKGDIPSPVNPPQACRFHTRCPIAQKICSEVEPIAEDKGGGHIAACHFAGQLKLGSTALRPDRAVQA